MKTYKKEIYNSFSDFIKSKTINTLDNNSLCIFDVDGIFFKGIYDPRAWIGIVSQEILGEFEAILHKKCACWIITNRPSIFRKFPFINQIRQSIRNTTGILPPLFLGSTRWHKITTFHYVVIINAKKPKSKSRKIVEAGSKRFKQVFYIASPETPFWFSDERLLYELSQYADLSNVTLVKIAPWYNIKTDK